MQSFQPFCSSATLYTSLTAKLWYIHPMYKRAYIEISNICNLQCSFCPEVERENEVLSPENFKKILSQVAPKAEQICLHLMGEPLAHPQFSEILKICNEQGVQIQLTTNAVTLEHRQDKLFEANCLRQINFSVQSYRDNFPSKPLESYMRSLTDFCKSLFEKRPEVYVNFRLWNIGRNETNENEEVFQILERHFGIEINRQIHVESIKSKRIWNRVYLHFDSHFEWPSKDLPYQGEKGRCHGLINQIGIHANGTVVPCCLDKEAQINLGNCLEDTLDNIISSPKALKIKEGFQQGRRVDDLCQHCTYINRF